MERFKFLHTNLYDFHSILNVSDMAIFSTDFTFFLLKLFGKISKFFFKSLNQY